MSEGFSLALTTAIKPPKKFTVDGEEFDLLGIDHLSAETEAEVMALFARYALLTADLENASNVMKGKEIAERMKTTRLAVLTKLTTMPKDTAAKLPLSQAVRLMEAIETEVEPGDDGDESGVGTGSGDTIY